MRVGQGERLGKKQGVRSGDRLVEILGVKVGLGIRVWGRGLMRCLLRG